MIGPSRAEGVRELVIAGTPYVAVYQVANDTVTVLQFLHTSQDRSDE
jgi:toxin ParE1/3/4